MSKPLWRLLLHTGKEGLSCADCFAILEYLADMAEPNEADNDSLKDAARNHLHTCPDCQEYYLHRLNDLEQLTDE